MRRPARADPERGALGGQPVQVEGVDGAPVEGDHAGREVEAIGGRRGDAQPVERVAAGHVVDPQRPEAEALDARRERPHDVGRGGADDADRDRRAHGQPAYAPTSRTAPPSTPFAPCSNPSTVVGAGRDACPPATRGARARRARRRRRTRHPLRRPRRSRCRGSTCPRCDSSVVPARSLSTRNTGAGDQVDRSSSTHEPRGQHAGEVRGDAAAGDVRERVHGSREPVVARGGARAARCRAASARGAPRPTSCRARARHPCSRQAALGEDVPHEREAVGVQARSTRSRSTASPSRTRSAPSSAIGLDDADRGAGHVVVVGTHEAGVLGRLAADECGARLGAGPGDARDDGGDALGHDLAARDVVGHEERRRTDHDDVVDDHAHEVLADGVVLVEGLRDRDLGADAVGGGGQQRPRVVLRERQVEQPGEAADARRARWARASLRRPPSSVRRRGRRPRCRLRRRHRTSSRGHPSRVPAARASGIVPCGSARPKISACTRGGRHPG